MLEMFIYFEHGGFKLSCSFLQPLAHLPTPLGAGVPPYPWGACEPPHTSGVRTPKLGLVLEWSSPLATASKGQARGPTVNVHCLQTTPWRNPSHLVLKHSLGHGDPIRWFTRLIKKK